MKILLSLLLFCGAPAVAIENIFRLHLPAEPSGLEPHNQRTSSANYLLGNLYRNIYTFDDNKGLVPDLGKCHKDKTKKLICRLNKDLKWSDGSPLTAQDFLKSYQKILDPSSTTPRADLLFRIKNAQDIYLGKKKMEELAITAPDTLTLKFEFQDGQADFEYNLASILLAPTTKKSQVFSGPYKIKEWVKGHKIILEPNPLYKKGHLKRPQIEFLFIQEDTVALQLYEKNHLQFLRRLPTLFIPKYKDRKDFIWQPVTRLDYFGFGPEIAQDKNNESLRKAFTYSLNYIELQKIFSSEGKPGCIGLPNSWFPDKAPCFDFDLKKVPAISNLKVWTVMFSALGGEDHKRATEWMQAQWLKHAGLKTNLESKENKVYLQILKNFPPALFRKGVAPERPTCLAALETFSAESGENYIRLKSDTYGKTLAALAKSEKPVEQKKLCLAGVNELLKNHLIIPMGAIHFSMLAKPEFMGWKLNQLNQLDLSGLHLSP